MIAKDSPPAEAERCEAERSADETDAEVSGRRDVNELYPRDRQQESDERDAATADWSVEDARDRDRETARDGEPDDQHRAERGRRTERVFESERDAEEQDRREVRGESHDDAVDADRGQNRLDSLRRGVVAEIGRGGDASELPAVEEHRREREPEDTPEETRRYGP